MRDTVIETVSPTWQAGIINHYTNRAKFTQGIQGGLAQAYHSLINHLVSTPSLVRPVGLEPTLFHVRSMVICPVDQWAQILAESTGIEPVQPRGLYRLATCCLTGRPTLLNDGGSEGTRTLEICKGLAPFQDAAIAAMRHFQ